LAFVIREDVVMDLELLLELLARERVTRIVLVPILLRVLLKHAPDLEAIAVMEKPANSIKKLGVSGRTLLSVSRRPGWPDAPPRGR
jgi:hypothetical protein